MATPTFTTIIGPAHWASYFVNDDSSGLDEEDQGNADAWLKRERVRIVGTTDEESYFSTCLDMYAPECGITAGEVVEYLAEPI